MKTHNLINVVLAYSLAVYVDLTEIKWEDLVNPSTITDNVSICLRVPGNPKTQSILMSYNFHVGTSIILVKTPGFRCSALTFWQF